MNYPEELIHKLEQFHFNRMEAQVYIALLGESPQNGSQIAKALGVPRTSVYDALEALYKRGAVFLLAGEPATYRPQEPTALIGALERTMTETAAALKHTLSAIQKPGADTEFWNIQGATSFKDKVRQMINTAQKEVLMNTNFSIDDFASEVRAAAQRGVRVILFSFNNLSLDDLPVEFYHNPKWSGCEDVHIRMMLVIDFKEALIANGTTDGDYSGTFSSNRLLTSIVTEHIHHDIYMLKIEETYGSDVVKPTMSLQSLMEIENPEND